MLTSILSAVALGALSTPALAQDAAPQDAEIEDRVPLVRLPPVYPMLLMRKGLAAHCIADFDIRPNGSTANVCVTCSAEDYARAAASDLKNAIDTWRYEPVDPDAPNANVRESVNMDFRVEDGQQEVPEEHYTRSVNCESDT